jgi:hypothetical protein
MYEFIVFFICFFDGIGYKDKQDKLADVVSTKKRSETKRFGTLSEMQ